MAKGATTSANVGAYSPTAMPGAAVEENLVSMVEFLRAELRRKDEQLLRKDGELLAAQTNFAELDACSREVEQELESEIAHLSRLNRELEDANRGLERRLQVELRRATSVVVQPPQHEKEAAQLRRRLQRLEQENDDLQSSVRRLEATVEDVEHQLERVQEEVVFAQQERESFKEQAEARKSKTKASCLESPGMPHLTEYVEAPTDITRDALELDFCMDETDEESDSSYDEDSFAA